jgi:hypothetical protein
MMRWRRDGEAQGVSLRHVLDVGAGIERRGVVYGKRLVVGRWHSNGLISSTVCLFFYLERLYILAESLCYLSAGMIRVGAVNVADLVVDIWWPAHVSSP